MRSPFLRRRWIFPEARTVPVPAQTPLSGSSIRSRVRGQAAVEFAFTIVLLLFVVLGLIEVARWFNAYLAVQFAAREAGRYAVTGKPSRTECVNDLGFPGAATSPGVYRDCRLFQIKSIGRHFAQTSLMVDDSLTDAEQGKPRYLGVLVSSVGGLNDVGRAKEKIQITVVYNHPVTNPFLATLLPTIRVIGSVEMINEPWAGGGDVTVPDPIPAEILAPLDSDGDGWSDADEVNTYGTFPGNPDSDEDGYCEGDGRLTPSEPASSAMDPKNPSSPPAVPCNP